MVLEDGRTIAYTDVGEPGGFVVMYFHGAPSSRLDLAAVGLEPALIDRGVRVVSADRPGYGGSSPLPGRTMDQWPPDVETLADHLGIGRFAVIGMSSGGPYAVACAALLGSRVVGCGVVAGVTDMGWSPAWDGFIEYESAIMRIVDEREATETCERLYGLDGAGLLADDSVVWAPADLALFENETVGAGFFATSSESLCQGVAGYAQDIVVQGRPWPFDPGLVTARCRILHGMADTLVPVAHARHTTDIVPGAELVTWPDHGHLSIIIEIPDLAADLAGPHR